MTLSSSYKAGSITVAAGGTQVVGTGTNWTGFGVRAGDILWAGGIDVAVASVESATALTLAFPWGGPALSGSAYEIRLTPDAARVLTASREAIASIEDFRGDAWLSAGIYASTAAGLAATQRGAQFQVKVGDELVRYRKDAGPVATELARYMTGPAVTAAVDRAVAVATPSYVSREAAVAGAPALATSVTQILVREGTALVLRSRTASADDPLFPAARAGASSSGRMYRARRRRAMPRSTPASSRWRARSSRSGTMCVASGR